MKKPIKKTFGRSIVELMIAMAIGLVIMGAIAALFTSSSITARTTDDKSRMDEDGRLALNLIAFHLRMVGYGRLLDANPSKDVGKIKTTFEQIMEKVGANVEGVEGCHSGMKDPRAVPFECDGTKPGNTLVVRYFADQDNANKTGANIPTDCLGQGVTTDPAIVESRFYIATNPQGVRELYCAGNGGTAFGVNSFASPGQPLAENVMDMQILYGYDVDADQAADGFYTAAELSNPTTLPPPSADETTWSRVVSAKVCLLLQSANDNVATAPQSYRDCSGNLLTATDRRYHSVYATVVALRSRVVGGAS